jgi:hypothetical protein
MSRLLECLLLSGLTIGLTTPVLADDGTIPHSKDKLMQGNHHNGLNGLGHQHFNGIGHQHFANIGHEHFGNFGHEHSGETHEHFHGTHEHFHEFHEHFHFHHGFNYGGGSGGGGSTSNPYGNWVSGDSIYQTNITNAPTNANSGTWLATYGSASLHQFYGTSYQGAYNGYMLNTAPTNRATTPASSFNFLYGDESDQVGYYIDFNNDLFEGNATGTTGISNVISGSGSDCHWMCIVQGTNILQEIYGVSNGANLGASWQAGEEFDLGTDNKHPDGWTSADDSGQAMTPISIKYEEMSVGPATHPLRMTINHTDNSYGLGWEWPGSHAGNVSNSTVPPEGAWWRLNPGFDVSGYSQINQNILNTLKTYGAIVADNGSIGLTGNTNVNWNDSDLHNISVTLNDGVFIDVSGLEVSENSYQAASGGPGIESVSGGGGASVAGILTHHTDSQARAVLRGH